MVGKASEQRPSVYSIAAHRGFADALAAGLLPRYRESELGLARLTLLLPSSRAARAVTEAFVRISGNGLLLPRMAIIGDLDLDERLGPLLDPLGSGRNIPAAVDPTYRWLHLAEIIAELDGEGATSGANRLRLASRIAQTMDRLLIEGIGPEELLSDRVIDVVGDLAEHWQASTKRFAEVQAHWSYHLRTLGRIDAAERRNRLFETAADRWKEEPPATPIIAAGVTSAAPALARLLKVVTTLPDGAVILPDFDLGMDAGVWQELGRAGIGEDPNDPPFARGDAVSHPQYHLKLLLNRMGISRDEVQPWHRAGSAKGPPERSHAISALFLPPDASAVWADLPSEKRRLSEVRIMQAAHPGEEAQAIALLIRQALDEPEKRVALVTPDRTLARRVVAHLERWNIVADDSAGRPLSQTSPGRLFLLIAEVAASDAAAVPVIALLGHPLVSQGEGRNQWLRQVRRLEEAMRGPRGVSGLAAYDRVAAKLEARHEGFGHWWADVRADLATLLESSEEMQFSDRIDLLVAAAEKLCGDAVWSREDGRALSAFVDDLRLHARDAGTTLSASDTVPVLREAMESVAVRPPYGGHPRVAIYGLLESRMTRADLVICAGLNEGTWPASSAPDPILPPPVLRALGVPGNDFRIGLSAHDLASALGAPEVVLSRSVRDMAGPAIPSRFLLRVQALLGPLLERHEEHDAIALAAHIDVGKTKEAYRRPKPMPSAEQRKVRLSATALDRLRSDPYQFYAQAILRLRALNGLDSEPTPAWQGQLAHDILEAWHLGQRAIADLADRKLEEMAAHPLIRALWRPRLLAALEWIVAEVEAAPNRSVVGVEAKGDWQYRGVTIHGRADRIDRLDDGTLAIVDYKTGKPPSARMVEEGYALQLGTLGLIAGNSEFRNADGTRVSGEATGFEYWSLGRAKDGFGYIETPLRVGRKRSGLEPERMLPETQRFLDEALDTWILGDAPFTARLNPDQPGYADYDQLMRLSEWFGREGDDGLPS